jgi:hypothetical protein
MLTKSIDFALLLGLLVAGVLAAAEYASAQSCPNGCEHTCEDIYCKVSWVGGAKECIIVMDEPNEKNVWHCNFTYCNYSGNYDHTCQDVVPAKDVWFYWSEDCDPGCDDSVEISQDAISCFPTAFCVQTTGGSCTHWNQDECVANNTE